MERGKRISEKTQTAIKNALLALIHEKNYPDITVKEITQKANTGRSTLYKHYQSKADVLVAIHKDIFEELLISYTSYESWTDDKPSRELLTFLEKTQRLGSNPFQLSYKLGSDLDYLITNINRQLFLTVEKHLQNSLSGYTTSIPMPLLAQSISQIYVGLIMTWFTDFQSYNAQDYANHIHRIVRALFLEALEQPASSPQN